MFKYIFIISLFLFQIPVFNTMGLADLVIFFLNIYYLTHKRLRLPKTKYKSLLLIFFCWLIIEPIFLTEFDIQLFVNRVLRLTNLFFGVLIIPNFLFKNKNDLLKIIKFLCIICGLFFFLIVLEIIMLNLNYDFDLRLINRGTKLLTTRPRSIYSEPSLLAIVLVFTNFIIFSTKKIFEKSKFFFNYFIILNTISILLTFSFSGFFGILIFLLLTQKIKTQINILIIIFIFSQLSDFNFKIVNENVLERYNDIVNKDDSSTNQRLIGSWTVPFVFLDNKYIGAGTGQEIPFLNKLNLIGHANFSANTPKINNSLALIFLENGIVGLVIFLLLILSFYRVNKLLPALILFYSFTHGQYFSAVLWSTVIVFISLSSIRKYERQAIN